MRGGGRGVVRAAVIAVAALLLHAAPALSARTLPLRPVLRAPQATAPGAAAQAPVLDPAVREALERRSARWRSFPDFYSPPGVDWSRFAARRSGWQPPSATASGTRHRGLPEGLAPEGLAEPPDTIRVALIRIDFLTDRTGNQSTGNGKFDLSGPDTTAIPIDRPPHDRPFYEAHLEALKRYYDAQSYGRSIVIGDVWPRARTAAYHVSDMADFGPWEFSQDIYGAAVHMFRTMLFAADSQSTAGGDRIPWDDYDRFIVVHAGGDLQSDVRQDSPQDIPSFTLGVVDSEVVIFPDSLNRPIDRALFVPETVNQDGYYGAINGVIAHECGHLLFNLIDLYDINLGYPVVGYWSLMDSGNLLGSIVQLQDGSELYAIGLLPPSVDAWQRQFLGDGLVPQVVAWGDTMTILDSERHPDVRAASLSSDEYLLFENRFQAPVDSIAVEQDDSTRVVLGPGLPDRFEYDMLLPGSGILVWHIDESVIPFEDTVFPCDTARANPDCGVNTNFRRRGVSVVEADGLNDLGDLGSPYLLGAPYDPYFRSNNPSLSDTTAPDLRPHIGTRPHMRFEFIDDPGRTMQFAAFRTWSLPAWPLAGDFPPGGPALLAVDADGDRNLEVCWAGGDPEGADSTALFAVRVDGTGLGGGPLAFAHLDRRPRPVMAALPTVEDLVDGAIGPSLFAVTTYADGPDTSSAGGRVWLLDHNGIVQPGWPAPLPSVVTTPPVIVGAWPNAEVYVGCADGKVYGLGLDGVEHIIGLPLGAPVSGRLAVLQTASPVGGHVPAMVAAGAENGMTVVFSTDIAIPASPPFTSGWPRQIGGAGFEPDFLWLDFGGAAGSGDCFEGGRTLVIRHADRMWATCTDGQPLPGWGRDLGDTLVSGLGAGDPDGDGFPEVLTQSMDSRVAFWNLDGYPSPGWPRQGSRERFRSGSPPLAVDLDDDGRSEVVAMNASGVITAMDRDGRTPEGWPLATGLGATGAALAADLDRNGSIEIVAPDRRGVLYAYSVPTPSEMPRVTSWTMLGGDPGRTSALPAERTSIAPAASFGPLVNGSLKAFPNPARRQPVKFAYRLTEPAEVEFRIVDASGHEVASFVRRGRQSDNLEEWDPGALPAGLYVARLRFYAEGRERVEMVPLGLLR